MSRAKEIAANAAMDDGRFSTQQMAELTIESSIQQFAREMVEKMTVCEGTCFHAYCDERRKLRRLILDAAGIGGGDER